jgi:quinol monooxygenase YgiN
MNDEKIVLVARLKVKDDTVEEAKKAALEIVAASRAEEGNINYDIHQAIDDETVFVWHETWLNKAAIDEHFEKEFFKEFFAKVSEFAAEPPQITLTKMITESIKN